LKAYILFFDPEKGVIGSRCLQERGVMSLCPCHSEENSLFALERLIIGAIQGTQIEIFYAISYTCRGSTPLQSFFSEMRRRLREEQREI
jgi:hypothetical protein